MAQRTRVLGAVTAVVAGALVLVACGGQAGALLTADVDRATPADAPVAELVAALHSFGADLVTATGEDAANRVLSPTSIALAFGMARAGAGGATAQQIDDVFAWPDDVHGAFNALEQAVVTDDTPPPPRHAATRDATDPQPPVVSIANGLFAQDGMAVKEPFLETLAAHYGAGVRTVDFTAADTAKSTIDAWVREQTAERIDELFSTLPADTRLVLANAVYLKADWEVPFAEQPVRPAPFTLSDGTVVSAETMGRLGAMRYATGEGWQAVRLPYAGGELVMDVLVPDPGGSPAALLAPELLTGLEDAMTEGVVDLSLPRWDFATSLDLIPTLGALGLTLPFTPEGDFSGINDEGLFIDQAVHRATITVDEWGTEAAAVTGLGFATSGPPEPDAVIHADHPFAFVIRHLPTGAPLFIGQVADPTSNE